MFRVYLFTFEGHLNIYFQNYCGKKNSASIQYLYGVNRDQKSLKKMRLLPL
jgi:NAD(P)H-quinone oxidoreductase subunit 5